MRALRWFRSCRGCAQQLKITHGGLARKRHQKDISSKNIRPLTYYNCSLECFIRGGQKMAEGKTYHSSKGIVAERAESWKVANRKMAASWKGSELEGHKGRRLRKQKAFALPSAAYGRYI